MSDILDPEEIDALMEGLGKPRASGAGGEGGSAGGNVLGADGRYDFATQDYAVTRLIPALSMIQSQFAEAFRLRVRGLVPTVEVVRSERIAVMKHDEMVRSHATACDITVIQAPPLGAPMFLVFEPELVFTLVDHFFGGRGRPLKLPGGNDFSPTELRFMERLVRELLPDIASSWASSVEISPQVMERQTEFRFIDAVPDNETLLTTRFTVTLDGIEGTFWCMVPWSAIDPIRDTLGGDHRQASRQEQDAEWQERLQAGVEATPLDVVAVLMEMKLPLKKVSGLRVGEILPIDSPGQVTLHIGGIPLLMGSFGAHDGQMAVRVESAAHPRSH